MNKTVSKYMAEIGRQGGAAAKGDKKRRSAEHYAKCGALGPAKRWAGHVKAVKIRKRDIIAVNPANATIT